MSIAAEKFASANKSAVNAGLAIARTQFAAVEQLTALNIDTAKSAFEGATEHLQSMSAARDPQAVFKLSAELAQPVLERSVSYARNAFTVATQAQSQLKQVVEAQAAELGRAVTDAFESVSKGFPAYGVNATEGLKSAFSNFPGFDAWTKYAEQSAQAAKANFETITQAATGKRRAK